MTLEERADVRAISDRLHERFPGKDVLSADEFSAYLGAKRQFVCNSIRAHILPGQKIGGLFIIPLDAIALWEHRLAKTKEEDYA